MEPENNSIVSNKERQILESQREIEWLKRQIKNYEQIMTEPSPDEQRTNEEPSVDQSNDPLIQQQSKIDRIRTDLEVITQWNLSKDLLTRNFDASHYILQTLYAKPSDHDTMERSRKVKDKIDERDMLTAEILKTLNTLSEIKRELAQTQKEILASHNENRQVMKNIHALMEKEAQEMETSDADITGTQLSQRQDAMEAITNRYEVVRNLMAFIFNPCPRQNRAQSSYLRYHL
ncbi:hypothetical protein BX666DRAFT_243662 [Dichotomocladium elegans]|nr:hypothetical protein BX666DRAFT_243662 [Dichotomocladium elegans]